MNKKASWRRALALASIGVLCGRLGHAAEVKRTPRKNSESQFHDLSAELDGLEKAAAQLTSGRKSGGVQGEDFQIMGRTCEALSAGSVALCAGNSQAASPAAPTGGKPQASEGAAAKNCEGLYWRLLHAKLLITAPASPAAARQLCMVMAAQSGEFKGVPFTPGGWCDFYVGYASGKIEISELMRTKATPEQRARFAPLIGPWEQREKIIMGAGGPDSCRPSARDMREGGGGIKRVSCEEARIYRGAYQAKDAARCGSSGVCRVLFGEGPANCARYEVANGKGNDEAQRLTVTLMDLAQRIQAAVPPRVQSNGLDEVREVHRRWAGLAKRCQAALASLREGEGGQERQSAAAPKARAAAGGR